MIYTKVQKLDVLTKNKIYLVSRKDTNYFMKKMTKTIKNHEYYNNEKNLRELKHPNIITLIDIFETYKSYFIVTEWFHGPDLYSVIFESNLSHLEIKHIAYSIISGIKYLHDKHIIHNDIKPENIVISDDKKIVKIVDFGLSCVCNDVGIMRGGTKYYLSPQYFNNYKFDLRVNDIWAFGVTLYTMLFCVLPFDDGGNDYDINSIKKIVCETEPSYESPYDKSDKDSIDLLTKILCKNGNDRWTSEQIMGHSWFYDLEKIEK